MANKFRKLERREPWGVFELLALKRGSAWLRHLLRETWYRLLSQGNGGRPRD